jgi:hypothetical protein
MNIGHVTEKNIQDFKSLLDILSKDINTPSPKSINFFNGFDDEMKIIFGLIALDGENPKCRLLLNNQYSILQKLKFLSSYKKLKVDHDLQMEWEKKVYEFVKELGIGYIKDHFGTDYSETWRHGNGKFFEPDTRSPNDILKDIEDRKKEFEKTGKYF